MKKYTAVLLAALIALALFVPASADAAKATDITADVKISTVIEVYSQKLPVVRMDAQFIGANEYTNNTSAEDWKDPGKGTRSITIEQVADWEPYFEDVFLDEIDHSIDMAFFFYDCIWANIAGPMTYKFNVEKDDLYEFVIVGAAQIKADQVDNDAKDRGFSISVDGGEKVQVNTSDSLATFRDYSYSYTVEQAKAEEITTTNGVNSQKYQMCYIYNIVMPLTKGEHVFEYWHLEYSGENDLSAVSSSRLNFAGAYVQRSLSDAELAAYTYPEVTTAEPTTAPETTKKPVETTAEPTTAPVTTAEPETEVPTDAPAKTDAPATTDAPAAQKKGCGSSVGAGCAIIALAGTALLIRRKRK